MCFVLALYDFWAFAPAVPSVPILLPPQVQILSIPHLQGSLLQEVGCEPPVMDMMF